MPASVRKGRGRPLVRQRAGRLRPAGGPNPVEGAQEHGDEGRAEVPGRGHPDIQVDNRADTTCCPECGGALHGNGSPVHALAPTNSTRSAIHRPRFCNDPGENLPCFCRVHRLGSPAFHRSAAHLSYRPGCHLHRHRMRKKSACDSRHVTAGTSMPLPSSAAAASEPALPTSSWRRRISAFSLAFSASMLALAFFSSAYWMRALIRRASFRRPDSSSCRAPISPSRRRCACRSRQAASHLHPSCSCSVLVSMLSSALP